MSKTFKDSPQRKQAISGRGRQRNISVRAVRRDPPDYRRLSKALIQLALAEAEAEAPTKPEPPETDPASDVPTEQERRD
jgi:hypothetical protein